MPKNLVWSVIALLLAWSGTASVDGKPPPLPSGARLIDGDIVGDLKAPDRLAVSPDGRRVAYVSRGTLRVSEVVRGRSRELTTLPGTLTALLDSEAFCTARSRFNQLGEKGQASDHHPRIAHQLPKIVGLKWSRDGRAVEYLAINRSREQPYVSTYTIFSASFEDGGVRRVTQVRRDKYDQPQVLCDFEVAADRRAVVVFAGHRPHQPKSLPLIWESRAEKPRATRFVNLVASRTSGRFLGVEIDTRQLVVTDEDFKIVRRLDANRPDGRYAERVFWSPDERYAAFVSPLPLPARTEAEIDLYDLKTGKRLWRLDGHETDCVVFSGRGPEAFWYGITGINHGGRSDGGDGSFVSRLPAEGTPQEDLVAFAIPPRTLTKHHELKKPYPRIVAAPDASRFVVALPRSYDEIGFRLWLVDRDGSKRPIGPDHPALYTSPYHVLAIVDGGKRLLGFDDTRLFSVPIDPIPAEETDDE